MSRPTTEQTSDRLLRLLLDAVDRHDIPLTVRQVETLARAVAEDFVPPVPVPVLTPTQLAVLRSLAAGETVAESARRMHISESTLSSHRGDLYRRMGVQNCAEAIAAGVECGLLPNGVDLLAGVSS